MIHWTFARADVRSPNFELGLLMRWRFLERRLVRRSGNRRHEVALLAQDEALTLRKFEVTFAFGVGFQARAVPFVVGEIRKRDQSPGDIVGPFVR